MVKSVIISSAALAAALLILAAATCCCPAANAFVAPAWNSPLVHHHHPDSSSTFYNNNHHQRSSNHQHTKSSSSCRQQQIMELNALLPSAKLTAIGMGVAKFYKTSPLIASFLTASTKAAFADSMAQYHDVCTTKFDIRRNIAMVLYSGTVLGMLCSIMYNKVFPLLFAGTTDSTLQLAIKMTLFDGFINAPLIWLPPAYIAQAMIYKYPKREAIQKYITDVKENGLLTKYWSVWIPCSFINFLFVPAHFRVAFVAVVSFFWMIILSLVANKSGDNDQDNVDSCPVEPEPRMLAPAAFE